MMALVSSELSSFFFRFRFLVIFLIRVFSHSDGFFKISIHLIWALIVLFFIWFDLIWSCIRCVLCEITGFSLWVFSLNNGCYSECLIALSPLNFLGKIKFSGKEGVWAIRQRPDNRRDGIHRWWASFIPFCLLIPSHISHHFSSFWV